MKKVCIVLSIIFLVLLLSISNIFGATCGDTDSNGTVNILDALGIAQYSVGVDVKNFDQEVADTNADGSINILDALLVAQYYVGVVDNLQCNSTLVGDVDQSLLDGNKEFAFDMFRRLSNDESGKNLFYSPISVSTALSMLYQGAEGNTKEEIAATLKYNGIDINLINEGYKTLLNNLENVDPDVDVNLTNSIWLDEGFIPKQEFLDVNAEIFGAKVDSLDLQTDTAPDIINQWISDSTNGLVDDVISKPVYDDVVMFLINAIYFKGGWTNPFNPDYTSQAKFITDEGNLNTVNMMHKRENAEVSVGDDYQAIRLPFGEEKVNMYFILPESGIKLDTFVDGLTLSKFNEIRSGFEMQYDLDIYLPRFEIEYGVKKLNDILIDMGMEDSFTPSADLTGIADLSTGYELYVSNVYHKAFVEVNEEGAEGAAATVIEVSNYSVPDTFTLNRAFAFLIVDESNDTILFMGKAADLTEF